MRQVSSAGLDYVGLKWTESLKARAWLVSKSMSFLRRTVSSQVGIFCGFARCGNCGRSQAILDRTPFRPFITCRSIPQRSIYLPSLSQHCLGTDGQELLASIYNYNYIVIYIQLYTYIIIEGSLEVILPTIWTDEKQSRAEAERRERLEERRVEEKESEERRCRCAKR